MPMISANSTTAYLQASKSYPAGVDFNEWGSDVDPMSFEDVEITKHETNMNGNLVAWAVANPIKVVLSAIPGTDQEKALGIMWENNRTGKGKKSVGDIISIIFSYEGGDKVTLSGGVMTIGQPSYSVTQEGRIATKTYSFVFPYMNKAD